LFLARLAAAKPLLLARALAESFVDSRDSEKNFEKELTADCIIAIFAVPSMGAGMALSQLNQI
jgi:hypothetical protein